jgi:hypothetical protein
MPNNDSGIFSNTFIYNFIVNSIIQPLMLYGVYFFYKELSDLQIIDERNLAKYFDKNQNKTDIDAIIEVEQDTKDTIPFLLSSVKINY